VAEDYTDCEVHGLVITARCDLEHEKVPILNYLPVVSFPDWLDRDGRSVFIGRLRKNTRHTMDQILEQNGHSRSVLDVQSPTAVLDTLFDKAARGIAGRERASFARAVSGWEALAAAAGALPGDDLLPDLRRSNRGQHRALCEELIAQRLNGYYFLPSVSPDGPDDGYVVLLREVRHLPSSLALAMSRGLERATFASMIEQDAELEAKLTFEHNDFCAPVAVVESPRIEHLMQTFTGLFSRIGLEDPARSYVDRISRTGCGEDRDQ